MTMFDETIKLHASAVDDDPDFSDDMDDDNEVHTFDDDDEEEEEVTMTSDDDDEVADDDEDDLFVSKHAEDATVFSLPSTPVAMYTPPSQESKVPEPEPA